MMRTAQWCLPRELSPLTWTDFCSSFVGMIDVSGSAASIQGHDGFGEAHNVDADSSSGRGHPRG
jgi:hypothetical protein